MGSILEDSVDENSLDDNLDDYDDNLFDLETANDDTYDDPFYSKEEKIKESKLLIDELDPRRSSDFLPFPECCGEPLYGHPCRWCTCERCGNDLRDGYCFLCHSRNRDSFTYDSTLNSFDNPPDFSYLPPQPQYVPYSCELCGNDAHHGYDCPLQVPFVISLAWETISEIELAFEDKQYRPEGILELFSKLYDDVQNIHEELAEYINTPNWNRPIVYYDNDDDEHYTIAITQHPINQPRDPRHYGVSDTFNVADLSPYTPNADFDDDSGSSRFLEGEDDTDQGGSPLSPTQAGPTESG
ncbi:hypothetical protein Tco_0471427 [Tanacetum coccineum]